VKPSDPWTYVVAAALMMMVGVVASWVPARRAMQADPMVALRYE
jgi:putative ABC transport system permease protein